MKNPKGIAANVTITGGAFSPPDKEKLRQLFVRANKGYQGERVEIRIICQKRKRSLRQNAFYWGVLVPFVRELLNSIGNRIDNELTHEFLKDKFLPKIKFIDPETGKIRMVPGSTAKLSKDDFSEFTGKIEDWAGEFFGAELPSMDADIYPIFA